MLLMDEPELYARKALKSSPGQLSMFTGLEHTGTAADFREDLHPRDDEGRFRPKGVAKAGVGPTVEESPTGVRKRTAKSSPGQMPLPLGDDEIAEAKRLIQQMRGEVGPRTPPGEQPFTLSSGKPEPVKPSGNTVQQPLFGEKSAAMPEKPPEPPKNPPSDPEFSLSAKPKPSPAKIEGSGKARQVDLFAGRGDSPGQTSFFDDIDPAAKNVGAMDQKPADPLTPTERSALPETLKDVNPAFPSEVERLKGMAAGKQGEPDIDALAKSAVAANENVWTHARSAGHNPIKSWTPEQRQAYQDAVAKHREAAQPAKPEPSEGRAKAMAAQKQRDEAGTNVKHSPAMQAAIAETMEKLAPKAPAAAPLKATLFHGRTGALDTNIDLDRPDDDDNSFGPGLYLSHDRERAAGYGPDVHEVGVDIHPDNLLDLEGPASPEQFDRINAAAKKLGLPEMTVGRSDSTNRNRWKNLARTVGSQAAANKVLKEAGFHAIANGKWETVVLDPKAISGGQKPARSAALDDKIASSTGLIAKIGKQMGVKPQDMDDFISDVQLKAIKGQGGYDAEKGEFSTWLATVARNHKMTQQTRQKAGKRAGVTQSLATPLEGGKGSLADTVAAKPEKREIGDALDVEKIREIMGSLPDRQREAFVAVMTGGKSVVEAAAEMGIRKQAVSLYVNLAKAKIKAAVGAKDEAEPAKEPPKPAATPQTLAEKVAAQRAAGKKAAPPKAKPKPKTMVSMSGGSFELVKENDDGTVTVKNDQGDEFTSDPGEDYQIEQRKTAWKKNEDGTYTAPNGVVWKKAPAGGEESPVNGKAYAGGALMPIHGQSQVKIGKGDGSGEQPDLKPGRPDENQEAKAKKKGGPRRPQRVRDRFGELVEVPEGHRPLESVVAGHPLKHNKLNDDALAYLGLTRKQAQEIGEIYEMDGGSPYVPNEILPPSTINRNVAPDDSWSILKKYHEHQEAKGLAARAKDADLSGLDPDMLPKAPPEAAKQPFSPEQAIKIAANNVKELRKQDVYRVLDSNPAEHIDAIADHVKKNRPELASEVDSALSDIHEERGTALKPAHAATPQISATAPPPPAKEQHPVLERLARSNDPTYTVTHGLGERDRWDLINHLGLAERAMKGENVLPDIMAAGKNRRSELDAEDAAAAQARNQEIAAAASRREAARQRLTAGLSRGTRGTLSLPTGTVTGTKVGPLFVHKTGTGYAISHQGTAGKIRELPKQADAVELAGVLAKVPGWDFTDANKMPESLRNAVGMAIRDHDNGDWEGIEKRLSQGGVAPPEQPPGASLTGWHKDEFTGLHDAMKKQLAGQGSRRQESLARSLMESSPPAVQKELFRALKSIAPEVHAAIAAKPGIHLHKETFQ